MEFLSYPPYDDKLHTMYDYHQDLVYDKNQKGLEVKSSVVGIYNPNGGKNMVEIDANINFHVETIQIQEMDALKSLSNIIHKTIMQEELSYKKVLNLLLLLEDIEIHSKSFNGTYIL